MYRHEKAGFFEHSGWNVVVLSSFIFPPSPILVTGLFEYVLLLNKVIFGTFGGKNHDNDV